jgi:hypothetical protein
MVLIYLQYFESSLLSKNKNTPRAHSHACRRIQMSEVIISASLLFFFYLFYLFPPDFRC